MPGSYLHYGYRFPIITFISSPVPRDPRTLNGPYLSQFQETQERNGIECEGSWERRSSLREGWSPNPSGISDRYTNQTLSLFALLAGDHHTALGSQDSPQALPFTGCDCYHVHRKRGDQESSKNKLEGQRRLQQDSELLR